MHMPRTPALPAPSQTPAALIRYLKRSALPALLLGISMSGCSHSQPVEGTVRPAMQHDAITPTDRPAQADATAQAAAIAAQFRYYTDNRLLDFRYTLTNHSAEPLAVFDRGSLGRTLDAVGPTGKVARPSISIDNGDVTLSFQTTVGDGARLLALELAPKGRVQVEAWEPLPGSETIKRVRVCVPVAPMRAGRFEGGIDTRDGLVRIATDAPNLDLVCSAWVNIAEGASDWTD